MQNFADTEHLHFADAQCDLDRAEFDHSLPIPHQYPQPQFGPRHRETQDRLKQKCPEKPLHREEQGRLKQKLSKNAAHVVDRF